MMQPSPTSMPMGWTSICHFFFFTATLLCIHTESTKYGSAVQEYYHVYFLQSPARRTALCTLQELNLTNQPTDQLN